jgi:hypothetical protein
MHNLSRLTILAATALAGIVAFGAQPQAAGVQAGTLTCNVSSGWGFIIGSSRDLRCVYSPVKRPPEHYSGTVSKFGVDIGYQQSAVIVWTVVAPTADIKPGSLAGGYGGVTGSATIGAGLGANVLVGGSGNTIALQPVSIEGSTGLNVAAGIAAISLTPAP